MLMLKISQQNLKLVINIELALNQSWSDTRVPIHVRGSDFLVSESEVLTLSVSESVSESEVLTFSLTETVSEVEENSLSESVSE